MRPSASAGVAAICCSGCESTESDNRTVSSARNWWSAIMSTIASDAIASRFTDYEGAVQSVMAIDTLLNGLVNQGMVSQSAAAGLRNRINQAYAAVREPNGFQPAAFRRALGGAVASIRSLR